MINITSDKSSLSYLSQAAITNTTNAIGKGNGANMSPLAGGGPPPGGPMRDAITQALSQLGFGDNSRVSTTATVTAANSSSSTNATRDPAQALAVFSQSLVESLQSQRSQAAGPYSNANSAADASLTKLQESFENLVSALGGSGSNATLSGFLQHFANNMAGASSRGNIISERV